MCFVNNIPFKTYRSLLFKIKIENKKKQFNVTN